MRYGGLSLSGGRAILIRSDFAGARARVVASRTHTFLQLDRYHRNTIEFFEIGNHLELAARILARPQFDAGARFLSFNVETNKAVYLTANGVPSKIRPAADRDSR